MPGPKAAAVPANSDSVADAVAKPTADAGAKAVTDAGAKAVADAGIKTAAGADAVAGAKAVADAGVNAGPITYDDFGKLELRVGEIKTAEPVKKSNKLLRLEIDLGEPTLRQVVAGIALHYAPVDLIGKKVVVVANLKPAKLMGVESRGMVLAGSHDGKLAVLALDRDICRRVPR